jgi:hypothetical protein
VEISVPLQSLKSAVKFPAKIYSGQVFYSFDQVRSLPASYHSLTLTKKNLSVPRTGTAHRKPHCYKSLPTSSLISIFLEGGRIFGTPAFMPMIAITVYDALGATHARNNPSSAGGFSWLWD